jgi:hypothetical protein
MQKAVEQRGVGALGVQVEGNDLWCLFNERNKIMFQCMIQVFQSPLLSLPSSI